MEASRLQSLDGDAGGPGHRNAPSPHDSLIGRAGPAVAGGGDDRSPLTLGLRLLAPVARQRPQGGRDCAAASPGIGSLRSSARPSSSPYLAPIRVVRRCYRAWGRRRTGRS